MGVSRLVEVTLEFGTSIGFCAFLLFGVRDHTIMRPWRRLMPVATRATDMPVSTQVSKGTERPENERLGDANAAPCCTIGASNVADCLTWRSDTAKKPGICFGFRRTMDASDSSGTCANSSYRDH